MKFTICSRGHTAQSVAYLHAIQSGRDSARSFAKKEGSDSLRRHNLVRDLLFTLIHGGAAKKADAVKEIRLIAASGGVKARPITRNTHAHAATHRLENTS